MKYWILLISIVISLLGDNNPRLYSLLGDKLFDASMRLEQFKSMESLTKKIETFQSKSNLVLKQGLELESCDSFTTSDKKNYLNALRNLDSNYKSLIGALQQELLSSIKDNNYSEFSLISDSGLIDIFDNTHVSIDAIKFYKENKGKEVLKYLEKLISDQKIKTQYAEVKRKEQVIASEISQDVKVPSFLRIIIKTSDFQYADTNSLNLWFGINGRYDQKYGVYTLNSHSFKRGGIELFDQIKVDIPLSEIRSISLKVQGHDAWHIDNISFQFLHKNKYTQEYKFDAKQWFSSESADLNRGLGCVIEKSFYL